MQRTPNCPNCCRNFSFREISKTKKVHIPLLLECGHTYCNSCIIKLSRLQKTQVACPECQHVTQLKAEGIAGVLELQPNVHVMGVLAANNYKRSLLENVTARVLPDNTRLNSKDGVRQAIAEVAKQKKTELAQNTAQNSS